MKIAIIQMDIVFGDPRENMKNAAALIARAVEESAPDVVMLPELWTTGYDLERLDEITEFGAEDVRAFVKQQAVKHGIHLVAGSVANRSEAGVANTMLVYDKTGEEICSYSKAHLFRLMNEEKYLIAGESSGHFSMDGVACAGMICYDIRFPEWMRKHAVEGTEVFFVVAEWPAPRTDHWRALLQSRAIENQAFVVACNRVGSDPANTFGGHSMVISPWGEILAEADEDAAILIATIDRKQVNEIRNKITVFEDRRPSLYTK
ncbi:carbon-nitrogen family hydrolase [Aureibacillus halotolerans]|uniref:Putative amidohydrolase n=1 Tax=Aureibacillus halotolerans TaxID=1508390 RepID=A0A4R6TUU8_9BACI|nr:carbon-nitrogen family hydrolase [Aureibacillus halotolerans]TDQ36402.1 putative amidohydrolase [Aureibacillus halotolerans]